VDFRARVRAYDSTWPSPRFPEFIERCGFGARKVQVWTLLLIGMLRRGGWFAAIWLGPGKACKCKAAGCIAEAIQWARGLSWSSFCLARLVRDAPKRVDSCVSRLFLRTPQRRSADWIAHEVEFRTPALHILQASHPCHALPCRILISPGTNQGNLPESGTKVRAWLPIPALTTGFFESGKLNSPRLTFGWLTSLAVDPARK
jgi:hypothetical protein